MKDEQVKEFWLTNVLTDFTAPCSVCGVMPKEGDIWEVKIIGGTKSEGHKQCLEKQR
jgi:hypothetical protein